MAVTADDLRRKPARSVEQSAWFETAFNEHWGRVYGVLFRLVGERAEAEDLALEAFWRLYRRPPSSRDNLAGWLYRVAANLGLNALRTQQRRIRYEEQAGREALASSYPVDPADEAELIEQRRLVQAALTKMKARSARLLVLRHSGLSYAEVAAAEGLLPGSVGTLLARAEAEFEKAYREIGGD